MRKRLLISATFGVLGLAVGFPLADRLGVSTVQALIFGAAAGAFLGYVAGVLLDVFLTNPAETE
jgi:hypothetical protein